MQKLGITVCVLLCKHQKWIHKFVCYTAFILTPECMHKFSVCNLCFPHSPFSADELITCKITGSRQRLQGKKLYLQFLAKITKCVALFLFFLPHFKRPSFHRSSCIELNIPSSKTGKRKPASLFQLVSLESCSNK